MTQDNSLREEIDAIIAPITIKTTWSKPRPFTEDRQIRKVSGKKAAAAKLEALFQTYLDKATDDATKAVDRLEVIDDTGRAYVKGSIYGSPVNVELSYQDKGRTLKVFVRHLKETGGKHE